MQIYIKSVWLYCSHVCNSCLISKNEIMQIFISLYRFEFSLKKQMYISIYLVNLSGLGLDED